MIEFEKEYIKQCLLSASNNLRLTSEKIEIVTILREHIEHSEDLLKDINEFKKITELSKLGIKFAEIYNFLTCSRINFLTLSDSFKEHCHLLVRELGNALEQITTIRLKELLDKINQIQPEESEEVLPNCIDDEIVKEDEVDETSAYIEDDSSEFSIKDELTEDFVFEDLKEESNLNFEDYEEVVLKPIKSLDAFLREINTAEFDEEIYDSFIEVMKKNAKLSEEIGFEILSNMHKIFTKGLEVLKENNDENKLPIIEGMRACLIVIVAVVRGKEVEITDYLNRAENLGKYLFNKT